MIEIEILKISRQVSDEEMVHLIIIVINSGLTPYQMIA